MKVLKMIFNNNANKVTYSALAGVLIEGVARTYPNIMSADFKTALQVVLVGILVYFIGNKEKI